MRHLFTILILAMLGTNADAKNPKLYSGPMVGSVTKTSAKVWLAYRGNGKNAVVLGDAATQKLYYPTNYSFMASKGIVSLTFDFTGLQPGHTYNVLVSIEGWKTQARSSFKTQMDTAVSDFSFTLGSCALMNTDWTRIALPGNTTNIFNAMGKQRPDFMVWLGDNIYYLLPRQYKNIQNMYMRNIKVRSSFKRFRRLVSLVPHYAIWDDHDYGPNDSDRRWALKDSALAVFKSFWPNTYPEQPQFRGNYFSFRYYDAEFFMLDDRYFRDPPGDSAAAFLGETQLIWLKNKLQLSDATFKFIAIGTQVLNENHFGETYMQYPKERKELFDFIANSNIKGVVFLTGDKHYSEICLKEHLGYPIIDFTSSPLTTPPLPRRLLGAYNNPTRIPNTDYGKRSFGKISLSGNAGDRKCTLQIYSRWGKKKRELVIHQAELQRK